VPCPDKCEHESKTNANAKGYAAKRKHSAIADTSNSRRAKGHANTSGRRQADADASHASDGCARKTWAG
jgi:hypothetical protein